MSAQINRAMLLMDQNRPEMAARELQTHLAQDPNDAHAHALLAFCLTDAKDLKGASDASRKAITLAPDYPFAHYVAARVLFERNYQRDALEAVNAAIRLDPEYAAAYGLLAQIHLDEKRHKEALAAADRGLEIDPEDVTCRNLRAMALKNLGRHDEAADAIGNALEKDPENSFTHANQGWALLERGDHQRALEHFQEALRIDPTNEWAREGIVYSLKARYRIYAIFLRYFLWMSKLSQNAQWAVIIGVWFASRILGNTARANPQLAPYLEPLRILLYAFAIMTWVADPLFNLALRMNRYGRLALTRDQVNSSTLVGLCVDVSLGSLALAFTIGPRFTWLLTAAGAGVLIIPLSAIFNCQPGWPRKMMTLYSAGMLVVGLVAFVSAFGLTGDTRNAGAFGSLFFLGAFLSGWIANLLIMRRPRG